MLRFAFWFGLLGVASSLGWALVACLRTPLTEQMLPYLALFFATFISFGVAVMAHPARTGFGGHYSVDASVLRFAAGWTQLLLVSFLLALVALGCFHFLAHRDEFLLNPGDVHGRLDRQLTQCILLGCMHAAAVAVASSGLRWGVVPARGWPGLPLGRPGSVASSDVGHGRALDSLPGSPVMYRGHKLSWGGVLMQAVIAGWGAWAGPPFIAALVPSGERLPYLLLCVPLYHALLKVCARVTFQVQEGELRSRHFPFSSRDRNVPIAAIRGIQVNAERNSEGEVTHYSLLLLREHSGIDRLINQLPNLERARSLAQQLDERIRAVR